MTGTPFEGKPPRPPPNPPVSQPAPGLPVETQPPRAPARQPASPSQPGQPFEGQPPRAPGPVPEPTLPPGQPFQGNAPSRPVASQPREDVGRAVEIPVPQGGVAQVRDFKMGFSQADAAVLLPPGVAPLAQNIIAREGGVEPRYRFGGVGSPNLLVDVGLFVGEYSTVTGQRVPVAFSRATFAYMLGSTWTTGSYSTQPTNDPLSGANTDYIDADIVYHPTPDENGLVFVNGVDRAFFWGGPSSRTFSTLTNAPIAKTVTNFDSRVVFGNIVDSSTATRLIQRVQWSARGDPETYSEPTGGAEDLLDARGAITRIIAESDRLLIFFEYEIWAGLRADFPFDLQFIPVDRSIGCMAPWTITQTPRGVAFLGHDNRPYIMAKGSTPVPIGAEVWRYIRDTIDTATQSAGGFNPATGELVFAFPVAGGSSRPGRAVAVNIETGAWAPHTYDHAPVRFGLATMPSSGTTFGGLVGTFAQQTLTYGQLAGTTGSRALLAVTSNGTVAQASSSATNDLGTAVEMRHLAVLPNDDPSRRQYVREIRLDYRADSASSLTLCLSADFGSNFVQEIGVALPAAPVSGQTIVCTGFNAIYPALQIQHDQGHRFAVQRATALVERVGRA